MQPNSLRQFDNNAESLVQVFQNMGVCAVTGADELEDLTLADSIGHVSADVTSRRTVFDAYHTWLTICMWTPDPALHEELPIEPEQTPAPPAPPPPPPARFHAPWAAVYCNVHHTYYY